MLRNQNEAEIEVWGFLFFPFISTFSMTSQNGIPWLCPLELSHTYHFKGNNAFQSLQEQRNEWTNHSFSKQHQQTYSWLKPCFQYDIQPEEACLYKDKTQILYLNLCSRSMTPDWNCISFDISPASGFVFLRLVRKSQGMEENCHSV